MPVSLLLQIGPLHYLLDILAESYAGSTVFRVTENYSFSSSAFVNPTLFSMLRKHREFNEAREREIQRRKNEETELLQQQQEHDIIQGILQAEEEYHQQQSDAANPDPVQVGMSVPIDPNGLPAQVMVESTGEIDMNQIADTSATCTSNLMVFHTGDVNDQGVTHDVIAQTEAQVALQNDKSLYSNDEAVPTSTTIAKTANGVDNGGSQQSADLDQGTINDALARLTSAPLNTVPTNTNTNDNNQEAHPNNQANTKNLDGTITQEVQTSAGRPKEQENSTDEVKPPLAESHEDAKKQSATKDIPKILPQEISNTMFSDAIANSGYQRSVSISPFLHIRPL